MTDQVQHISNVSIVSEAMRSVVLGWMNVSNNGPISQNDTRNPFISNTTYTALA